MPGPVAPLVAGLARYGFHAQPTQVVLAFDTDLDPALARNLALYAIVHPGRDGRFGTRDDRVYALKSAVYDEALRTVTLTPRARLPLNGRYRVVVRGSQPLSATGQALDGDADGAREIDDELRPIIEALAVTTNPIPVKAALNMLGHDVGGHRLPLVDATEDEKAVIRGELERAGILAVAQA